MKVWIEKAPYGGTKNRGKYLLCCDKVKFPSDKKTIIGRIYKGTLTDDELEELKEKIERVVGE